MKRRFERESFCEEKRARVRKMRTPKKKKLKLSHTKDLSSSSSRMERERERLLEVQRSSESHLVPSDTSFSEQEDSEDEDAICPAVTCLQPEGEEVSGADPTERRELLVCRNAVAKSGGQREGCEGVTPLNSPGAAGKGSGAEHHSSAVGLGRGGRPSGNLFTEMWAQSPGAPLCPSVLKEGAEWHCRECESCISSRITARGGRAAVGGEGSSSREPSCSGLAPGVLCSMGIHGVEK